MNRTHLFQLRNSFWLLRFDAAESSPPIIFTMSAPLIRAKSVQIFCSSLEYVSKSLFAFAAGAACSTALMGYPINLRKRATMRPHSPFADLSDDSDCAGL